MQHHCRQIKQKDNIFAATETKRTVHAKRKAEKKKEDENSKIFY